MLTRFSLFWPMNSDDHDVDVGAGAELPIVVVDGAFVDAGRVARALLALVPDVVDGDRLHVRAVLVALHDAANVGVHPPAATDEADVDAIVGPDDAATAFPTRVTSGLLASTTSDSVGLGSISQEPR